MIKARIAEDDVCGQIEVDFYFNPDDVSYLYPFGDYQTAIGIKGQHYIITGPHTKWVEDIAHWKRSSALVKDRWNDLDDEEI